jgi:hypothetical protein
MWYSICYGLIFNMILFKFTLKLIEIDSMKAHMIFNWLLFNYQHNSIQNFIFSEFWYSPAHMCLTFLFLLIKSDLLSTQDKILSFRSEMILHINPWNRSGKHHLFIFQYYILPALFLYIINCCMLNIFLISFENFKHLTIFQYLYYFHSVLNSFIQSPLSCK